MKPSIDLAKLIAKGFSSPYAPVLLKGSEANRRQGSRKTDEVFLIDHVNGIQRQMLQSLERSISYENARYEVTEEYDEALWIHRRPGERFGTPIVEEDFVGDVSVRLPGLALLFVPGESAPAGYVSFLVSFQIPAGPITFLGFQMDVYDAWIKRRHRGHSKSSELAGCAVDVTLGLIMEVCRLGLPTLPDLTLGYASTSDSAEWFMDACEQAVENAIDSGLEYCLGQVEVKRYEFLGQSDNDLIHSNCAV